MGQLMTRQETEAAFAQFMKGRAAYEDALKAAQRRRDEFEDRVARYVSAEPDRVDWYAHPGCFTRDEAAGAAGLTSTGLHRLMDRYRKRHPAPKLKPKQRRTR